MNIREFQPEDLAAVRELYLEYQASLDVCLCFQDFEREVAELPGVYAPPAGRLFLAQGDARPAGCIALRNLGDGICEMKRLFVRPEFRGQKIGARLVQSVIAA